MTVPAVYAHRGSPDPASGTRENTLEAFFRARLLGADGVELDVRRAADGSLAVHHDPDIRGVGPVHELVAEQLRESVALLPAALDACAGLAVNIELKNLPGEPGFDPEERLAREVADLVMATGREDSAVISSFWPGSLDAVREVGPGLATGLLIASWFDPALCVALAVEHGCTAIHPHVSLLDRSLMDGAREAGMAVATWTVNEPSQLDAAAAFGVTTVITDDVTMALTQLGRA